LGVELPRIQDDVRLARDAESAHLEAGLKIDGAKYLRLARLRDILGERGFHQSEYFELKAALGNAPQLWLDLRQCVTMEPDAGTYRLAVHGADTITTSLETNSLDEIVAACSKQLAHGVLQQSRTAPILPHGDSVITSDSATLIYVWFTGVVTGIAALTLYAILMKRLLF
jgi:hypothetical protein